LTFRPIWSKIEKEISTKEENRGIKDAVQFHTVYSFFSDCGSALFCGAQKGKISVAFSGKLLFLYVLERKVRSPAFIFHGGYLFQRAAD
jgi:hypothetical protein